MQKQDEHLASRCPRWQLIEILMFRVHFVVEGLTLCSFFSYIKVLCLFSFILNARCGHDVTLCVTEDNVGHFCCNGISVGTTWNTTPLYSGTFCVSNLLAVVAACFCLQFFSDRVAKVSISAGIHRIYIKLVCHIISSMNAQVFYHALFQIKSTVSATKKGWDTLFRLHIHFNLLQFLIVCLLIQKRRIPCSYEGCSSSRNAVCLSKYDHFPRRAFVRSGIDVGEKT